jgi:hypothetical protein
VVAVVIAVLVALGREPRGTRMGANLGDARSLSG